MYFTDLPRKHWLKIRIWQVDFVRLLIANSKIICPSPGLKFKRPRRISQKESLNVPRIASWLREVWRKLFEKAMTKKRPWKSTCYSVFLLKPTHEKRKGENPLVFHDFVLFSFHRWTFHQIPKVSKACIQCWAMHVWHTFILHPTSMKKMLMKASTSWDDPPTLTLYLCGYRGAVFSWREVGGLWVFSVADTENVLPRIHSQISFTLSFGEDCNFSINSRLSFKIDCWVHSSIYFPFVFWRWCLQCLLSFREISAWKQA